MSQITWLHGTTGFIPITHSYLFSLADSLSLISQSCQGGQEGKAGSQEACCSERKGKISGGAKEEVF